MTTLLVIQLGEHHIASFGICVIHLPTSNSLTVKFFILFGNRDRRICHVGIRVGPIVRNTLGAMIKTVPERRRAKGTLHSSDRMGSRILDTSVVSTKTVRVSPGRKAFKKGAWVEA